MKNVKIKNNLFYLCILCFMILGCYESKNNAKKSIVENKINLIKTALDLKIDLSNYGTYDIDIKDWKNHLYDTVAYFHVNLKNLKKEPFVIKTHLVATNIPFVIEYRKLKKESLFINRNNFGNEEYINLNIIYQFNTIYVDSLIFSLHPKTDYPHLIQVFQVGYQKVGGRSLCELPFEWRPDTLDISNPKNKHVCCIEVNR